MRIIPETIGSGSIQTNGTAQGAPRPTRASVILERASRGDRAPDPAFSILKLRGSELQHRASELLMEVEGSEVLCSLPQPGFVATRWDTEPAAALNSCLHFREVSIYGGANQIQKNIIAKTILGL